MITGNAKIPKSSIAEAKLTNSENFFQQYAKWNCELSEIM